MQSSNKICDCAVCVSLLREQFAPEDNAKLEGARRI